MSSDYPHFNPSYTHEELIEHFLLTPADLQLVWTCRGEANQCGMALLLKALIYLGYVPDSLDNVPPEVRSFIAGQLGLLWDFSEAYGCKPRHNFVYLSADLSRPYRFIVTPQICICGFSPGKGLNLPLWGVVAGEVGLE